VVVIVGLAAPAGADKAKKEADRHFKLGVKLYGEAKWTEALVEFQRAYDLAPHPILLYNLAAAHRELSHYHESIQHFERFLEEAPGQVKPEVLEKATRELEELRARVATLEVTTKPTGALVVVDGREVGTSPLPGPLVLGPGEHRIEARGQTGQATSRKVTLAAGDATSVHLEIAAGPAVAAPVGAISTSLEAQGERRPRGRPWLGVGASMATNTLQIAETGAPMVGVEARLASRLAIAINVVAVAWAVVPSLRLRLFGDDFQGYLAAAVPVAFVDGERRETFAAGAGGLGLRWFTGRSMAVRAEALVSYAGGEHGLTVPASLGVELWF
jgi:hypothetical protein